MIQWIARRKNTREPPRFERVPDQLFSERGGVTSPVVLLAEDPSELDVVFVEVATGSKAREVDRFVVGFQHDSPVAEVAAVMKVAVDERFRLGLAERAFVEEELHQCRFAQNRDEPITVSILVGS
jgi:hypothetical protein